MSQYGAWSVKGIDDRARAVAKEEARLKGITLGDYINELLLKGHSEAGPRDHTPSAFLTKDVSAPSPERTSSTALDSLASRIEAVEARSTLAITGIDQSVLGLLARLEGNEAASSAMAGEIEAMVDELRRTHETLQGKVEQLESEDAAGKTLESIKALENALGKLASHVFEEAQLTQDETVAMKGRMEAGFADHGERIEGMELKVEKTLSEAAQRVEKAVEQAELRAEGTARHLSERFSVIETTVATKLGKVDEMQARLKGVEGDVSGAIQSMEGTLLRIQERLNRAENTTDAALKALEHTFASLDERIDGLAAQIDPEKAEDLRQKFEARFEDLAADLRANVEQSRESLANQIEAAATGGAPEIMGRFEATLENLKQDFIEGEDRANENFEALSEQIGVLAAGLDERLTDLETRTPASTDGLDEKLSDFTSSFERRIADSERRSASAIEQVGEQVASAIQRVHMRQETQHKHLEARLTKAADEQGATLSTALSNISERLSDMQTQTESVVSPVQKAIVSLAARLEMLEDGAPAGETVSLPPSLSAIAGNEDVTTIYEASLDDEEDEGLLEAPETDQDYVSALPDFDEETEGSALGEADDDYVQAQAHIEDEITDPAEINPLIDLADWSESEAEAREVDVFAEMETEAASSDTEEDTTMEPVAIESPDLPVDEEATNYLARARKAAIAASSEPAKAKSPRRARLAGQTSNARAGHGRRLPILLAASTLAISAAGAGGWIYLRGKQDTSQTTLAAPIQAVPVTTETIAEVETPLPSLEGVTYDASAGLEGEMDSALFDLEEGSTDQDLFEPDDLTPAELDLPLIPVAQTLEQAALNGNPIAEYQWGEAYLDAKDYAQGADFVRRAADQGLPAAQYRLAKLYESGLGVPRDLVGSRVWTERAARSGNVKAMHDLAVFFADGEAGAQSYAAAAEWFRKAADFGLIDSQYNLALLYENGLGISPSKPDALYWFEIAAKSGDPSAADNVARLREEIALEEAQASQRRAAIWEPRPSADLANGKFGPQAWEQKARDQVHAVQTVLNGLGYEAGTPDGVAGAGTRTAIRAFQADQGLRQTGEIDEALIKALNSRAQS